MPNMARIEALVSSKPSSPKGQDFSRPAASFSMKAKELSAPLMPSVPPSRAVLPEQPVVQARPPATFSYWVATFPGSKGRPRR